MPLWKNLLVPKTPNETTFDNMVKILKGHFTPTRNITYEMFIFNKRQQKEGESLTEYSSQLKQLA